MCGFEGMYILIINKFILEVSRFGSFFFVVSFCHIIFTVNYLASHAGIIYYYRFSILYTPICEKVKYFVKW